MDLPVVRLPLEHDVRDWGKAVRALPQKLIIIDCPPSHDGATGAALVLADLVLTPIGASALDIRAANKTLQLLLEAREARGDGGPKALIVPAKISRVTSSGKAAPAALAMFGETIAPVIGQRAAVSDAAGVGMVVTDYSPGSLAAKEMATLVAAVEKGIK